ncbi:ATP-binding protein [Asticcacaulis sp. AND118]|uniref:sensor histidine kinase n=1 Tax=Asticcacaulis sp. AND118 TaxID=2840468 RepID=UPI001CFF91C5|nr:ATP-binding protein [Asticcacaulis sp. AND118]UDF03065.1 hypothetical protein LH365_11575 [Asticcacaulis sp. AND118]
MYQEICASTAPQTGHGTAPDARDDSGSRIHDYVEQLCRSNQALDDFAYLVSHDLKEPLRGLSQNACFLLEDYADVLDETGRRRLSRMDYLCRRMERLIDDLMQFSRLDRQALAVQPADLNAVIADIVLMLETTLHERQAVVVTPRPLPVVTCDVSRVTEVFRNLITNAVKYNRSPAARVEIGCIEDAAPPIFYVRDNGIGIDRRYFDDIFRLFRRLNEEDERVKGAGVGLTFVKKIIERHDGRIWLESTPGNGTTFFFTLGAEGEAGPCPTRPPRPSPAPKNARWSAPFPTISRTVSTPLR